MRNPLRPFRLWKRTRSCSRRIPRGTTNWQWRTVDAAEKKMLNEKLPSSAKLRRKSSKTNSRPRMLSGTPQVHKSKSRSHQSSERGRTRACQEPKSSAAELETPFGKDSLLGPLLDWNCVREPGWNVRHRATRHSSNFDPVLHHHRNIRY